MVSAQMFLNNIMELSEKGICLVDLFESNIFSHVFDFDEWPSTHTDDSEMTRPYNGSIFDLRSSYKEVFHEDRFKILSEIDEDKVSSNNLHKIRYKVNMLPFLGEYIQ